VINISTDTCRTFQPPFAESREPDFSVMPKALCNRADIVGVRKWWREHFIIDGAALHKSLACPVLVVNGVSDFRVNAKKDARALAPKLRMASARM